MLTFEPNLTAISSAENRKRASSWFQLLPKTPRRSKRWSCRAAQTQTVTCGVNKVSGISLNHSLRSFRGTESSRPMLHLRPRRTNINAWTIKHVTEMSRVTAVCAALVTLCWWQFPLPLNLLEWAHFVSFRNILLGSSLSCVTVWHLHCSGTNLEDAKIPKLLVYMCTQIKTCKRHKQQIEMMHRVKLEWSELFHLSLTALLRWPCRANPWVMLFFLWLIALLDQWLQLHFVNFIFKLLTFICKLVTDIYAI